MKERRRKRTIREHYLTELRPFCNDSDRIKVITGIRRCGKSNLLNAARSELHNREAPEINIIYINPDHRKYNRTTGNTI